MNMIQPGTGLIVAMAQSRPVMGANKKKGETYWNLSVEPEMGGIQGYQAGSTFKLFTLAAALEKGIPINKKFNARSPMEFGGKYYQACTGREKVYGRYTVRNAVGHSKTIAMTEAAEFSVNTYFVQLELATGMCRVTKMAKKMGVKVGHAIGQPPVDLVEELPVHPLVHPRHRRGQPAVDGRGVRHSRRAGHPLQPGHHLQDHHPQREEPGAAGRQLQAG